MKLPLSVAEKLLLLARGEKVPASKLKQTIVERFIENGVLKKQIQGRQKVCFFLPDEKALHAYLQNHFGIHDLALYVENYGKEDLSRAEAIEISADSKLRIIRTFKGFLCNCYQPVSGSLNGQPITIHPQEGSFTFIYDFEGFRIDPEVTVVGIENPENFRFIRKQSHLFPDISPLFVSRYPQSKDLIRWLQTIPNPYLHFGDFDPAGIRLYLSEFGQYLGKRARFLVPEKLEALFPKFGNRALYDKQLHLLPDKGTVKEDPLLELIDILHKHKKGLEQEIFLKVNRD